MSFRPKANSVVGGDDSSQDGGVKESKGVGVKLPPEWISIGAPIFRIDPDNNELNLISIIGKVNFQTLLAARVGFYFCAAK